MSIESRMKRRNTIIFKRRNKPLLDKGLYVGLSFKFKYMNKEYQGKIIRFGYADEPYAIIQTDNKTFGLPAGCIERLT